MQNFQNLSTLRALTPQLLRHRKGVIIILFLHVLWGLVELIFPFLTQALVDRGIRQQDLDFIHLIILAQLMLYLGSVSTELFKSWMLTHIGVRLSMHLVSSFLNRVIIKNVLFFNENVNGKLLQLVNDTVNVEKLLTEGLLSLFNASFRILLFSIILYIFSPIFCLIFIVSIILSISWDLIFLKERKIADQLVFDVKSKIRSELLETSNGIADIKVNNKEWSRIISWNQMQNLHAATRLKLLRVHQIYKGFTLIVSRLRDIIIIFLSAKFVVDGTITLGAMLAIQYILGQLNTFAVTLTEFIEYGHDANLSMARLRKVMNEDQIEYYPARDFERKEIKESIIVENLNFRYQKTPILKNVNIDIPYGANIALVGESGSGKSTLIYLLLKLINPTSGTIYLGNFLLNGIKNDVWRENYGICLQDGYLFNKSLKFNVTFTDDDDDIDFSKFEQCIKICELEEVCNQLEHNYNTVLGQSGKLLSRGQRQRVLIARAVYRATNYIILDEPTSGLDNITGRKIIDNITTKFQEKTIIVSTHKVDVAKRMNHVYLIKEGELIENGSHQELMDKKGLYFEIFRE